MAQKALIRIVSVFLALLMLPLAGVTSAQSLVGSYTEESAVPVVTYLLVAGEVNTGDAGPSIAVYGDGEVQVHFPNFMTKSGDYTLQLSPSELEDLLASFDTQPLAEFSAAEVQAKKQQQTPVARGGEILAFDVQDADIVVIEFPQRAFEESLEGTPSADSRIVWRALRSDAEQYSEIQEIQDLSNAELGLRQLLDRNDLQPVGE